MKIMTIKLSAFVLFITYLMASCTISTDDFNDVNSSDIQLSNIETSGWVFGDLILKGSGFDTDCSNNAITINNGTTMTSLDLIECTESQITARIPEDATPGLYSIVADLSGNSFTSINNVAMEVQVKIRPVILSMSKTTMEDGETISINGLHLTNPTNLPQYNPKVWIMKSGYTNTVSDISVNSNGTGATVEIDEGIDPGEYRFLLTTEEWSNEIAITII